MPDARQSARRPGVLPPELFGRWFRVKADEAEVVSPKGPPVPVFEGALLEKREGAAGQPMDGGVAAVGEEVLLAPDATGTIGREALDPKPLLFPPRAALCKALVTSGAADQAGCTGSERFLLLTPAPGRKRRFLVASSPLPGALAILDFEHPVAPVVSGRVAMEGVKTVWQAPLPDGRTALVVPGPGPGFEDKGAVVIAVGEDGKAALEPDGAARKHILKLLVKSHAGAPKPHAGAPRRAAGSK